MSDVRKRRSYQLFLDIYAAMQKQPEDALREIWRLMDARCMFGTARKSQLARESVEQIVSDLRAAEQAPEQAADEHPADEATQASDNLMACPVCRCTAFVRRCEELVLVHDEGESVRDEVISDPHGYTFTCHRCGCDVTDEELVRQGAERREPPASSAPAASSAGNEEAFV